VNNSSYSSRRAIRAAALLFALPALGLATACGSGGGATTTTGGGGDSTGSGGSGGSMSALQTFQATLATSVCGAGAKCCTLKFHEDSCAQTLITRDNLFPEGANEQNSTFDAAAGAACIKALTVATGQCDTDPAAMGAALDVCETVLAGTKKDGDACTRSSECASVPSTTRRCDSTTHLCAHTPITIVSQVGGPCTIADPPLGQPIAHCDHAKFLWCNADTLKCEAPAAAGALCDVNKGVTCAAGTICFGKNMNPAKCVAAHDVGEGCWDPLCDFKSDPVLCACGTGTSCDSGNSNVCEHDPLPGEACSGLMDCLGDCTWVGCVTRAQLFAWAEYCQAN
jgi:hypothetical protein